MFVDSVYRLDIPAGFDIMPEFKVCIKGDGRVLDGGQYCAAHF